MGYIPIPHPLIKRTDPHLAKKLLLQQTDAVLLVPTCPICQQTAGLVARIIEEHQIPTITLNLFKDVAETVKAPRTLHLRFPYGSPVGLNECLSTNYAS